MIRDVRKPENMFPLYEHSVAYHRLTVALSRSSERLKDQSATFSEFTDRVSN